MNRTILLAALPLITLGACADQEAGPENELSIEDSLPADSSPSMENRLEQTAEAAIPALLQGIWGLTPNDCDATRGDAKGRMEIGPRSIRFYESSAALVEVEEIDEGRLVAAFDFAGEGERWSRTITLDAQADGQSLTRRDNGDPQMPTALEYSKCPG